MDRIRILCMIVVDLLLVALSLYLSFHVRWEGKIPSHVFAAFKSVLPWVLGVRVFFFAVFDIYRWSFRYASLADAMNIFKAVATGSLILTCMEFYFEYRTFIGRSVPLIDFLFCFFFILASRFFFRFFIQLRFSSRKYSKLPRVLIVGAGRSGESVVRELINTPDRRFYPVGFVDDSESKQNQRICGLRVLGKIDDLAGVVLEYRIDEIIIAIPSAPGNIIRSIINSCQKSNVRFKIIPGLHKILSGQVEMRAFRNVEPEDLLGREAVSINTEEVSDYLKGRSVLISGAGGSIGSEIVRRVASFNPKRIILVDHNENDTFFLENDLLKTYPGISLRIFIGDITDVSFIRHVFSSQRPEVVFHAAAHKHVPLMEANPASAVKNNIFGTRNLIYAAEHYGVLRFVMISTDKAVNPTSVMGTTKRVTELLCQVKSKSTRTKFMAVRFGNVIGSNGSVVQLFKRQIEAGGPITVTHPEIRRFFMTVGEAASLVLQAGAIGTGGEIFILDMGEQIKIVDLAKNLIVLSGLEEGEDINIQFSGLRPGEKLYEEVLHDSEHDLSTRHDKIFVARPEDVDAKKLKLDIRELTLLAKKMDGQGIIQKLQEMIPNYTYTPGQNSHEKV